MTLIESPRILRHSLGVQQIASAPPYKIESINDTKPEKSQWQDVTHNLIGQTRSPRNALDPFDLENFFGKFFA
jgi:hypothetical protein